MTKANREQLKEEFLFAKGTIQGDATFLDIARADNLNRFTTKMTFINAAVMGGKLTTEEAGRRGKDLYKVWKDANKSLEQGWR
mgnify:CR=1 FL=1